MSEHYDDLETRSPEAREADLFAQAAGRARCRLETPAYAERLAGVDPAAITDRKALASLPILRKAELPALHKAAPPFGGLRRLRSAPSAGCSPRPARSSSRRGRASMPGARRAGFSPPVFAPATSSSTPSATI